MITTANVSPETIPSRPPPGSTIQDQNAVSWAAILAGALTAAVLSLLLFILGIGLGLSSISVWSGQGADGSTIGWAAVSWFAFTQLASAAMGGYIAGRLRTRWEGVHTDEVYFRDTAHGFLAWSFATLMMVALMGSVAGSAIIGSVKAAGAVASGAASMGAAAIGATGTAATSAVAGVAGAHMAQAGAPSSDGLGYWVNSLFRSGGMTDKQQIKTDSQQLAQTARSAADVAQEVTGIFAHALQTEKLSDDDSRHIAQLISQRTDLSSDQAQEKVQKTFAQVQQSIEQAKQKAQETEEKAKQATETARKATAYSMLWVFVALLIGAFVASLSATWGGRQRDAP